MKDIQVYRGENKDFNSRQNGCVPSVYRNCIDGDLCENTKVHVNEVYERYKDSFLQFYPINEEKDSDTVIAKKMIKRLGVMQHYGMQTPLLDVTPNIKIARFFACNGEYTEDGYIYSFTERSMLGFDGKIVQMRMEKIWNNIAKDENNNLLKKMYCFDYASLFSTNHDNIRYKRQDGRFILHGYLRTGETYIPDYPKAENVECIPYKEKITNLLEMTLTDGITEEYLFPDRDEMVRLYVDYKKFKEKNFDNYKYIMERSEWKEIETRLRYSLEGYVFLNTSLKEFYEKVVRNDNCSEYSQKDLEKICKKMKKSIVSLGKK